MTRDLDAPWVFVDPGKHASGVAWFRWKELRGAEYRRDPVEPGADWYLCVCEKPQVYAGNPEVRTADLVDLAIAAGRMTGQLQTTYVTPASWKGSAKKAPMHERMAKILTPEEMRIVNALDCAPSLRHNVFDAICMGLKWLGRWR